ncbi:MAG: threonine synthase [Alphaproteobacteria bacterium]|nr:threonine synthase [Alphaproteobacteria bacterium]
MKYVDRIEYWASGKTTDTAAGPFSAAPGDFPEVRYDLERLKAEVDRASLARGPASMWRYAPMLPLAEPANAVTLGEGWTPLLPAPALAREFGLKELWAKDEGRNPSGTFKDRGASCAVSRMRELGAGTVVHNSSGNAAGSWALYAARGGLTCVNLLPDDVLPGSLQQSVLSGAPTFILDGPWQEAGGMVADAVRENGWTNIGTLREPYRLEGKKTMGYEIAEQMNWTLPDALVYPCGGGLGAIAIYKAFEELRRLGWVEGALPKLIIAQFEGCAPIVRAFEAGADHAELWTDLDVPPGGLKSTKPPGDKAVLELIRKSGGTAVAVSTEDAIRATERMTRLEGLFPCPESATTAVALHASRDNNIVKDDDQVVLVVTGSGLKSLPVFPDPQVKTVKPGTVMTLD